jgi:hypothetical protein
MLSNVAIFFLFVSFAFEPSSMANMSNNTLSIALLVVGITLVIVSFLMKQKMLQLSVAQQKLDMVQTAFVLAWAIAEAAALLGILDRFLTGNPYYFILLAISFAGIALNIPKRDHLLAATYKLNSQGSCS